ncbi:hypothetical protein Poly24_50880 [Rosistilla carotiformis]|uniref:Uncharacterized protein n=1 Tax=Rosistilla carotiformis TaxID=2528017 RepID=A0A518K0N1_9BACT|nr:hypothetical protein Poly24_50880 [Rosistilla carotiformis]
MCAPVGGGVRFHDSVTGGVRCAQTTGYRLGPLRGPWAAGMFGAPFCLAGRSSSNLPSPGQRPGNGDRSIRSVGLTARQFAALGSIGEQIAGPLALAAPGGDVFPGRWPGLGKSPGLRPGIRSRTPTTHDVPTGSADRYAPLWGWRPTSRSGPVVFAALKPPATPSGRFAAPIDARGGRSTRAIRLKHLLQPRHQMHDI